MKRQSKANAFCNKSVEITAERSNAGWITGIKYGITPKWSILAHLLSLWIYIRYVSEPNICLLFRRISYCHKPYWLSASKNKVMAQYYLFFLASIVRVRCITKTGALSGLLLTCCFFQVWKMQVTSHSSLTSLRLISEQNNTQADWKQHQWARERYIHDS